MKISEVCARTGLTDRTVRFYIEKGLLKKSAQHINGRNCRDYDEDDIRILTNISTLRKAGFSIQDILDMQNKPEKVNRIITAHSERLQQACEEYEGIIKELKSINERGYLSWNKLADLLASQPGIHPQDITFRWPDEPVESEKKKNPVFHFLKIGIALVSVICVIVGARLYMEYEKPISTIFLLSDVTFHEKWSDNGLYLSISCGEDAPISYDSYFFAPRTLQIESSEVYQAIVMEDISYACINVMLEMSYGEARKNNWINDGEIPTLKVEEILSNPSLIKKYCTVVSVHG